MFTFELKRTEAVNFEKPLGAYIKKNYPEKPKSFVDDFRILENLRKDAVLCDVSLASATNLHRYYEQLKGIQSRFPIDEANIKLAFAWYNSLPKEKRLLSSCNIQFEKASLLFNIAMIYARLASQEMVIQPNIACNQFMNASGVLKIILDEFSGNLNIPPSCDLCAASITSFMKLLLAKAQECFIVKAQSQNTKDSILSKIAASCGDLYDAAFDAAYNQPISGCFGENWLAELQVKALYYYALAQWKKSNEHLQENKYGEKIARLNTALDLCQKAVNLKKVTSFELQNDLKGLMASIDLAQKSATRDNDLIYHDLVPDLKSLPILSRAEMVSSKNPLTEPINTIPLFQSLVPLAIHHAVLGYTEKKEKLVSSITTEFSDLEEEIQSALTNMNLPGSIEALEKPKGIPESVLKKSLELREANAASILEEAMLEVTSFESKTKSLLNDLILTIENEEREDDEMRAQFHTRWTRSQSAELNVKLVKTLQKYRSMLQEAMESDATVTKRYESYLPSIIHLCSSPEELEHIIPSCNASSPRNQDPIVQEIKQLLSQLDKIRGQERETISKIKATSDTDNITEILLQTPNNTNFEPIFEESLKKYQEMKNQIVELRSKHLEYIEKLREKNKIFESNHMSNASVRQREHALQSLEEGYQNYKTLSGNFKEGIKFYQEFMKLLQQLKMDIDDYCLSRKIEFKDLIRSIQVVSSGSGYSSRVDDTRSISSYGSEVNVFSRRQSDDHMPLANQYMNSDVQYPLPQFHQSWRPGIPVQYSNTQNVQPTAPPLPRKPKS